jgi:hypothetical protein
MEEIQDSEDKLLALVRRFTAQTELSRPSMTLQQGQELLLLLEQTILRYPHQDLSRAIEGFYHDYRILCERFGLDTIRTALQELRLMPGKNFFPQPSECAALAEEIVKKRNSAEREARVRSYKPCGSCHSGMVRVIDAEGVSKVRKCQCTLNYERGIAASNTSNVVDFKTRAAG